MAGKIEEEEFGDEGEQGGELAIDSSAKPGT